MKIKLAFLFDKKNNWLSKYFKDLKINKKKYIKNSFYDSNKISNYDVVFILGYTKKLNNTFLKRNKLNLLVHESNLPKGRGMSPVQWQILEDINFIKVNLIEAVNKIDKGDIFGSGLLKLNGSELYDEIRKKQASITISLIKKFLKKYPKYKKKKQVGIPSYYMHRNKSHSELNLNKTIKQNFNLLRISNNEEWPAFFIYKKKKFIIKIYSE